MKFFKNLAFTAITICALTSCSNDDENEVSASKVDAYIQFEQVFGDDNFKLNQDFESANNGTLNITTLKYIITDVVLHGAQGTEDVSVPTEESFHIVDQSCESTLNKYFTNIPNGTYNKVTFRYGVSDAVQNSGTGAQGTMLTLAKAAGLNWGWTLGYRFMTFEGISSNKEGTFKVHNGSTGALVSETAHTTSVKNDAPDHGGHEHASGERIDNSQLITLDFSDEGNILVSDTTSPKIHVKVDVAKILSSTHILDISEDDIIIDAHKSAQVAKNVASMFSIAHIHPTDINFEKPEVHECKDTSNPNEQGGHSHDDHDH